MLFGGPNLCFAGEVREGEGGGGGGLSSVPGVAVLVKPGVVLVPSGRAFAWAGVRLAVVTCRLRIADGGGGAPTIGVQDGPLVQVLATSMTAVSVSSPSMHMPSLTGTSGSPKRQHSTSLM